MIPLSIVVGVSLVGWTAATVAVVLRFLQETGRPSPGPPRAEPHVAVLLALRGTEPELERCLDGLSAQHYGSYDVRIVVDRVTDPVWDTVRRFVETRPGAPLRVKALRQRNETCSLKCSALLQMTSELEPDVDVIALVDGDAVPHPRWLADLVSTLEEPGVGVAYGVPWFTPARATPGATLRAAWWGLASIAMVLRGWAWGGSLAMTVGTLRSSDLEQRWARALSSDTVLHESIRSLGLRARWVPGLFLPNASTTSWVTVFEQITRYMAVRRLYLPGWSATGLVLGAQLATIAVAMGAVGWGLLTGAVTPALIAASGLVLYGVGAGAGLIAADRRARAHATRTGVATPPASLGYYLSLCFALTVANVMLVLGTWRARASGLARWKGATYRVRGPWDVTLVSDDPERS